MIIYYCDGSTLSCNTIQICGDSLYCDDVYIVPICEVERIETA